MFNRHTFALTLVDKAVLALAFLVLSAFTITADQGLFEIGVDIVTVFLVVFLTYGVLWFFLMLVTGFTAGIAQSSWMRWGIAILSFGFTLWLYPLLLSIAFWLVGWELAADVETILTFTFAFRFLFHRYLVRRWHIDDSKD